MKFLKWAGIVFGGFVILFIGLIVYEQYERVESAKRYKASWIKPAQWNTDLQKMLDDCVNQTRWVQGLPDNDDPKYVRISNKVPGKIAVAYGGKFEDSPPRALDQQAVFCVYDAKTLAREQVMYSKQGQWISND